MHSRLPLIYNLILFWLLLFGGCSCSNHYTWKQNIIRPSFRTANLNKKTLTGLASYYGRPFHGKTTASGERFNMYELTAAHKTLPFNTKVKVVNLSNKKSIIVRINDRGPYIKGRVIDLSYRAAQRIGLIKSGITTVRLEILP